MSSCVWKFSSCKPAWPLVPGLDPLANHTGKLLGIARFAILQCTSLLCRPSNPDTSCSMLRL